MEHQVVLIVDPDRAAREHAGLVLARAGLTVAATTDAARGLRFVSRLNPHALLTEIVLPKFDGFQFAKLLRRQEPTSNLGIIALTDYEGQDLLQRAAGSGIDRVLRKPCTSDELLGAVWKTLHAAAAAREQLAHLTQDLGSGIAVHRNLRARVKTATTELHETGERVRTAFGLTIPDAPVDPLLLNEADGARDVMLVDRQRGEQLFRLLFDRYGDHPLLYYTRGEAHRATGRHKLAHLDFVKAVELFPDGVWHERAKIAAMRTRSHHDAV